MTSLGISHKVDDSSGSIGRRYARTDEIAIPYALTIDFDSLKEPNTVTLRERDSMQQVRIGVSEVGKVVSDLCEQRTSWGNVFKSYPVFEQQQKDD